MNIQTLDGESKKWIINTINSDNKSDLHKNAAVLIRNVFPTTTIKEEVQIEVKRNKYLYLDFYLPLLKVGIEIDGQQHSKYTNFLSKNPLNFIKQKINDNLKNEWCKLNEIILIRLNYDEKPNVWREKLINLGFNNEK